MSNYFKYFPKVDYRFGNNEAAVQFQDIGAYIEVVDRVKEFSIYYEAYNIQNGMRPDQVSLELYGTPNYYWTFYLLNESLRTNSWPIRDADVYPKAKEYYPHMAFTTNAIVTLKTPIINKYPTVPGAEEIYWVPTGQEIQLCTDKNFVVGSWIYFRESKAVGKILKIDQDLGLVTTDAVGIDFRVDEIVDSIDEESALKIQGGDKDFDPTFRRAEMDVHKVYDQWDSPHHYEDITTKDWVNPSINILPPYAINQDSINTKQSVSYYQRLDETNNEQKVISVIRRSNINSIVGEFNRLMKENA